MQIAEQYQFIEAVEREFARKRASLLEDYKLLGRPVLIWQGAPIEKTFPNASLTIAKTAFDRGAEIPAKPIGVGLRPDMRLWRYLMGLPHQSPMTKPAGYLNCIVTDI
ncbi:hypothetical protein [Chitinimonas koreensis]|uniref:hypothetical protein n=1 Tax=Chitinimonas koreensis TaxID=356302 RepID=UPI001654688E|nr:hypothetical protein [Chitinimonas koreensis]QNM95487.1 hypothetical protein H9L41_16670 [Chitinimonas koreensis]